MISTAPSASTNYNEANPITFEFDGPVKASTVNSSNILIVSYQSGEIEGSFAGGGTSTITFTPNEDFIRGDEIRVTLTTNLENTSDQALSTSYSFQFNILTEASEGVEPAFNDKSISSNLISPFDVKAGDIDGDGDLDLVVPWASSGIVTWHENDGELNFTEHIAGSIKATGVFLADLNLDGNMDILAGNQQDTLVWFQNDGAQNFTKHAIANNAARPYKIYAIDFDGDGDMDVLACGYVPVSPPAKLLWYENNGAENFTEHNITGFSLDATEAYPMDMDFDGDMDIIVSSETQPFTTNVDKLIWLENDGEEAFTEHLVDGTQRIYVGIHGVDMDDDGDVDILTAASLSNLGWYENDGDLNFTRHEIAADITSPFDTKAADVDGDGDMDVIYISQERDLVGWMENDGNENFTQRIIFDHGEYDPEVEGAYYPGPLRQQIWTWMVTSTYSVPLDFQIPFSFLKAY
ncbi:FG-GAP-like repeat-containing protein [Fulvivirga ligni]|uniref:FG-GAP-like repeat-containing protein n=1 Tax=Fulvivirga ligni TaxID=2904246 RepID=UPI001F2CCC94|nr:FG-GAP-like repeat-containing protein [Fulvivirga ligni]UII22200.1 FG-GAP-like repeat-containing protein [Fulvivirga ligni]